MKGLKIELLLAIVLIPLLAIAQQTHSQQNASGAAAGQSSAAMASSGSLKILSPKVNARINGSSVTARYELTSDVSASSSPNFRLQLDSRDPVETTSTEHSFSGLAPGPHMLSIDVVDANGIPITGTHAQVQFTVVNQAPTVSGAGTSGPQAALEPPSTQKASLPLPSGDDSDALPSAATELPLLSMVGFGVLVGGVISAMRTRK